MNVLKLRALLEDAHERLRYVMDSNGARALLLHAIREIDDQRLTEMAAERYQAKLRNDSDRLRGDT
jgi:hypothetical protein